MSDLVSGSRFLPRREELERAIKELPRDKEVVQLYQKLAGANPLPSR